MNTLKELLDIEIQQLYSAEEQIIHGIPVMLEYTADDKLKEGLRSHLETSQMQADRLRDVAALMNVSLDEKDIEVCMAMRGIIDDAKKTLSEGESYVQDAAIISAARKIEHYEISSYLSAIEHAEFLGFDDVVNLLESTLDEEQDTDLRLSRIASRYVYPEIEE